MDDEIKGLENGFVARHTTDPELRWLSTINRPTGRFTENSEQAVVLPVVQFPLCVVESVESTNNSPAAIEQGVARASSLMHRVMEERAERERWRREMNLREREIRTQRARERMEREAREVLYLPRGSETNINLSLTGTQWRALEQSVKETCPLGHQVLRIREEPQQFGREIERKEPEKRKQRAQKKREREARELQEAMGWLQQHEAITGPWCMCTNEGGEAEQGIEALSEPQ